VWLENPDRRIPAPAGGSHRATIRVQFFAQRNCALPTLSNAAIARNIWMRPIREHSLQPIVFDVNLSRDSFVTSDYGDWHLEWATDAMGRKSFVYSRSAGSENAAAAPSAGTWYPEFGAHSRGKAVQKRLRKKRNPSLLDVRQFPESACTLR
jgi:hypothetical protein